MATKCHLNEFLTSATYLKESIVTKVRFPVVQIMGLDAHLYTMRLKGKKSYVLEEVCAFPFPVSLFGIRSGGIETLINGLSAIECLLLELERIYEEARNYEEDSIERVARGSKRPRKFLSKDWLTDAKMEEEE